MQSKLDLEENS